MERNGEDVAASVLAMSADEVLSFVDKSLKTRTLSDVVRRLNRDALSKRDPRAGNAARALRKLGFVD